MINFHFNLNTYRQVPSPPTIGTTTISARLLRLGMFSFLNHSEKPKFIRIKDFLVSFPSFHPVLRWATVSSFDLLVLMHDMLIVPCSGPLVIYDPLDPLRLLYDIDDGSCSDQNPVFFCNSLLSRSLASTVITLADWYHQPAEAAFADKTIIAP